MDNAPSACLGVIPGIGHASTCYQRVLPKQHGPNGMEDGVWGPFLRAQQNGAEGHHAQLVTESAGLVELGGKPGGQGSGS